MDYAPDHIRPPQKCMLRIYRDTRFSADKTPYKTNLAAWWTRNGLEKTSGGGYYSASQRDRAGYRRRRVHAAEGATLRHSPTSARASRASFGRLIENKKLRAKMTLHDPQSLTRPPKGFPRRPSRDRMDQVAAVGRHRHAAGGL